jgi:hypothetical protein
MNKSLIQSDAPSVGLRYAKRKESDITWQGDAKQPSSSTALLILPVTAESIPILSGLGYKAYSGVAVTQKFCPWETLKH